MAHEDLQSVTMAVLAADDRRRAANMANDADALEAILAPDFTYTHNTGFREGRDAYLARIRTAQVRYLSLDRLAAHVRVYGDVALVDGLASMTYQSKGGAAATVKTLYLGAWVRSGGAWRMAAYASTLAGD
jgi:ketosteroid isomerase-like protein